MGKKIPMWQCVLVLLIMIGFLMWGILKDSGGTAHIALICSAIIAGIVAIFNGWKWTYLEQGILAAINRSMQACLILAIVGAMIASWIAGGTVPSMMYFGIKIIAPSVFLFTACLLCAIVSLATGSSWSTAGSMGVALIGVGTALGFPTAMTAGAVVSGAYFGDKMSPLSDTTNLAPAVAGSNLFEHIKHMIWTTGPSLIIALIVYLVLGFMHHSGGEAVDTSTIDTILNFVTDHYQVGIIYLIPPVFVICAVAFKLPAIPSLLGGVALGVPFMLMQGCPVTEIMYSLNNGVVAEAVGDPVLDELAGLLSSKGLQGMFGTISLILCAMWNPLFFFKLDPLIWIYGIGSVVAIVYFVKNDFINIRSTAEDKEVAKAAEIEKAREHEIAHAQEIKENVVDITVKHHLTTREAEVAMLIYKGLSNPDIANELFISENTVKRHLNSIFKKLQIKSRYELITLIHTHTVATHR